MSVTSSIAFCAFIPYADNHVGVRFDPCCQRSM